MAINQISRHLELPLNKRGDKLCVDVNESSGRTTIDLRRWYTNDDDILCPTSKGVSIPVEHIGNVQDAIVAALASLAPASAPAKKPAAKKAAPKSTVRG